MGRGRAKAMQAKIARDLKYQARDLDLERLSRELSVSDSAGAGTGDNADSGDDADDEAGYRR